MAYNECYSDTDLGNFTVEEKQLDLKEIISYNFSNICVTWDHWDCTLRSYLSSKYPDCVYDNFISMQGDLFLIFIGLDLQQDHNDALVLVENGTYVYETDGSCVSGTPFHVIQLILRESQECNVTSTPSIVTSTPSTVTPTCNTPVKPSTSTSPRSSEAIFERNTIIGVLLPITIILGIDLLL